MKRDIKQTNIFLVLIVSFSYFPSLFGEEPKYSLVLKAGTQVTYKYEGGLQESPFSNQIRLIPNGFLSIDAKIAEKIEAATRGGHGLDLKLEKYTDLGIVKYNKKAGGWILGDLANYKDNSALLKELLFTDQLDGELELLPEKDPPIKLLSLNSGKGTEKTAEFWVGMKTAVPVGEMIAVGAGKKRENPDKIEFRFDEHNVMTAIVLKGGKVVQRFSAPTSDTNTNNPAVPT